LGVNGPPRSDEKTCGEAPCFRCRRRRARISSPCMGWTLGEPLLTDGLLDGLSENILSNAQARARTRLRFVMLRALEKELRDRAR
jgi:hypothetical protein